jgi:hypothetical protein
VLQAAQTSQLGQASETSKPQTDKPDKPAVTPGMWLQAVPKDDPFKPVERAVGKVEDTLQALSDPELEFGTEKYRELSAVYVSGLHEVASKIADAQTSFQAAEEHLENVHSDSDGSALIVAADELLRSEQQAMANVRSKLPKIENADMTKANGELGDAVENAKTAFDVLNATRAVNGKVSKAAIAYDGAINKVIAASHGLGFDHANALFRDDAKALLVLAAASEVARSRPAHIPRKK